MSKKPQKRMLDLNFETVASLMAMLIGAVALFVAWDQAQVMRKQQHASVWPVLTTGVSLSASEKISMMITVKNEGVGPALVQDAVFNLAGEPLADWNGFVSIFPAALKKDMDVSWSNLLGVMGAGQEDEILRLTWPYTDERRDAMTEFAKTVVLATGSNTDIAICYCSVFEKCWHSTATTMNPQPVKQCKGSRDFVSDLIASRLENDTPSDAPSFESESQSETMIEKTPL